ncbi:hypothetical protein GJ496_011124 [Pomphorhynchus laevis]|nr:hypothetical protein GJ496_011124 [Pomphorhynchus laevis]
MARKAAVSKTQQQNKRKCLAKTTKKIKKTTTRTKSKPNRTRRSKSTVIRRCRKQCCEHTLSEAIDVNMYNSDNESISSLPFEETSSIKVNDKSTNDSIVVFLERDNNSINSQSSVESDYFNKTDRLEPDAITTIDEINTDANRKMNPLCQTVKWTSEKTILNIMAARALHIQRFGQVHHCSHHCTQVPTTSQRVKTSLSMQSEREVDDKCTEVNDASNKAVLSHDLIQRLHQYIDKLEILLQSSIKLNFKDRIAMFILQSLYQLCKSNLLTVNLAELFDAAKQVVTMAGSTIKLLIYTRDSKQLPNYKNYQAFEVLCRTLVSDSSEIGSSVIGNSTIAYQLVFKDDREIGSKLLFRSVTQSSSGYKKVEFYNIHNPKVTLPSNGKWYCPSILYGHVSPSQQLILGALCEELTTRRFSLSINDLDRQIDKVETCKTFKNENDVYYITRWKKSQDNSRFISLKSKKPVLQYLATASCGLIIGDSKSNSQCDGYFISLLRSGKFKTIPNSNIKVYQCAEGSINFPGTWIDICRNELATGITIKSELRKLAEYLDAHW